MIDAGRRGYGWGVRVLVLLVAVGCMALILGGCGDDPEPILTGEIEPTRVAADALAADPGAFAERSVVVSAVVERVLERDDALVLASGLLVIAPVLDDPRPGERYLIQGSVLRYRFADAGPIDFDDDDEALAAFDGDWALFATEAERRT